MLLFSELLPVGHNYSDDVSNVRCLYCIYESKCLHLLVRLINCRKGASLDGTISTRWKFDIWVSCTCTFNGQPKQGTVFISF